MDVLDSLQLGAVQVILVCAVLQVLVLLNVMHHCVVRDEIVVPSVDFLLALWSSGVYESFLCTVQARQ